MTKRRKRTEGPAEQSALVRRAQLDRFYWFVSAMGLCAVLLSGLAHRSWFADGDLLVWLLCIAVVELFPIPTWQHSQFTVTDPLWIGLTIAFPTPVVVVVSFIAAFDPREIRGEISLAKALFNRGQTALSLGLGSIAFHALTSPESSLTRVVGCALLANTLYNAANLLIVGTASHLDLGIPTLAAVRSHLTDSPREWAIGYFCFGMLGVVIGQLYVLTGEPLVVALSALPLMVMGRGTLLHVQLAQQEAEHARHRERQVRALADLAARERKDERRQLAAALHDEAIPAFQGMNLLAASASSLGADVPGLPAILDQVRQAADDGSDTLRAIVAGLRSWDQGETPVRQAIEGLVAGLSGAHPNVFVTAHVEELQMTNAEAQVLCQVAREALVNALTHSGARAISVQLQDNGRGCAILSVSDDGQGFDEGSVPEDHFGLALMRERASSIGAKIQLATGPAGTRVELVVPADRRQHKREGGL